MDTEQLERKIRERAYRIWVDEGRLEGRHLEHWQRAKREVAEESAVTESSHELKWN